MKRTAAPFIVMGISFIAIGITGKNAFLAIGVAFLVIGFVGLARQKREGGPS